ncbi:Hpt domain-containing protein [Chitinibacter sp. FCG-7]|uniref:Hpt domain-containing protein n=1 Tax=Chitinibacter mangrovi TaxID=3153927 RepID=A0AAU7F8V9_9NEIS
MGEDLTVALKRELLEIDVMFDELQRAVGMDMRDELLALFFPTMHECLAGLRLAIPADDWAAMLAFAHKLKGASGQLGAAQISAFSRTIEQAARAQVQNEAAQAFAELDALCLALEQHLAQMPG